MLKALSQELITEELLPRDATVVVGVSGGSDSMALLHLLLGLNEHHGWHLTLHVAHLDHQIRGEEAEKDAAFVRAAADSLSISCIIEKRDVSGLAAEGPAGVEEVGRRERYAFFERVCLRVGSKFVALGHHADDNAETILHRVLRGTGLRGLAGIPRSRPLVPDSDIRIVRPLLGIRGKVLREYLVDSGITFREDRTNTSREPMRNRIRHEILPKIEADVNPQVHDALIRLGEQAVWLREYLGETVQRTFETLIVSRTDQTLVLNADALSRKSRIVQTELIRLAYQSFGLGEQDLSFVHLAPSLDLIADPVSGKQLQLPAGMTIEKRYHQLIFSLPTDEPREMIAAEVAVHLPGRTLLPVRRLQIDCEIHEVKAGDLPRLRRGIDPMQEHVDFDAVHPPLVVRKRRPGDRFVPLGAPGSKSLSDFLIDAKVDPKVRERVAVLCDQLGPVWIIGQRLDDRVKITELTRRVLHLSATPLDP